MSNREMASNAKKYVLKKMSIVNTVLILCHLGFALLYAMHGMHALFFTNYTLL